MNFQEPDEYMRMERDEQAARLRLEQAREQNLTDEGVEEHESVIQKLEDEWKHAVERLKHARGS